jgi:SAM-dependent MidA family methyltransferase
LLVPSCRLIGEIHYRLIHATEANADKRNRYQVLDNQDQWQYDFRVVFANHIADAANCTLFNKQETHWAAHVWPEDVPYESLPATARVPFR